LIYRIDKDRELPIEYDYKNVYETETIMIIPDDYVVEYIPENYELNSDLMDVTISYLLEGNSVRYNHSITTKFIELSKLQQDEINAMIDEVSVNYKEVIALKKR